MKKREYKLFIIDGSNFDKCGENEYSSKEPAEILDRKNIGYEDLLKNTKVFYIDESKLSENNKELLKKYIQAISDDTESLKEILKTAYQEGMVIYENAVENINYEFPNKKRKSGNPEFDEYTI
jgi:predicted nucleotidyltransferase